MRRKRIMMRREEEEEQGKEGRYAAAGLAQCQCTHINMRTHICIHVYVLAVA